LGKLSVENNGKNTLLYLRGAMKERVYLLLGSNEGDRLEFLQGALDGIKKHIASGPLSVSAIYETAAWGLEEQPTFLNIAVGFDTDISSDALLQSIRTIESHYGRQREVVWGQRTLDIDVLFYGNHIIQSPELSVPHPRLQDRRFALAPLAEIAGSFVHPQFSKTVTELLEECPDPLPVAVLQ
jgi:2-amino-4-hydroxy-6-hydroxymethyldihydropteridine diphosphokinase